MIGLVIVSVAWVPLASAGTISAPYPGVVQPAFVTERQGCAKLPTPTAGTFSLKTGVFSYSAKSSAHACAHPPGNIEVSLADQEALFNGAIPLKIPGGSHSVAVVWKASWSLSGKESHTGSNACPTARTAYRWGNQTVGYCDAAAQADFRAQSSSIVDLTNHTSIVYTAGGNGAYALNFSHTENDTDWYCYIGGSCYSNNLTYTTPQSSFSWSGTSSNTVYINGTFVASHHYARIVQPLGAAIADCEGWSQCTASASLNLASGSGYGVTLASISIT